MKQQEEDFKFIKEEKDNRVNFILQKNNVTKIGFYIVVLVIVVSFIVFIITSSELF